MNRINGLYALTPDWDDTARLLAAASAALEGGVRLLQYRHKLATHDQQKSQAQRLLTLCQQYDALLIVNDNVRLAAEIGADGVHIGMDDMSPSEARRLLGPGKIIGVSCYNRLPLALEAQQAGADYVAFGSCFASPTKPQAVHAPLSLLREAKTCLQLPIVAIGGIDLSNAPQLIDAGADAVAVISALFDANDIAQTAQAFGRLFASPSSNPQRSACAS